ncbi:hypothetical protein ONZ45_g14279 [Pleurotus djamor]|nr:hypothetical protein ONZ45_g14279 [Pleurotus djamor]
MSAGVSLQDFPAHVVLLLDSSLALASQWDQILVDYLVPMFKAVSLTPSGKEVKPRIAVVTYAAVDVRPTPLVSKQFFAELPLVLKQLQAEPYKLGIGQYPEAKRGLCALEGFVAALEVFPPPYLPQTSPYQTATVNKDSAHRPRWNDAPSLDAVEWDSLSAEIRKACPRHLHPPLGNLAEFSDLHSLSVLPESGSVQCWFPVHPTHHVLLSGLRNTPASAPAPTPAPALQLQPAATSAPPKRPNDAPTPQADAKRHKPSPTISSPVVPPTTVKPAFPPQIQQAVQVFHQTEAKIKVLKVKYEAAVARGDTQEAELVKRELDAHTTNKIKIANFLQTFRPLLNGEQPQPQTQAQGQVQVQGQPASASEAASSSAAPVAPTKPEINTPPVVPPNPTQNATPIPPPATLPPHASPNAAPQPQVPPKVLGHQRQRSTQGPVGVASNDAPPVASPSLMNRPGGVVGEQANNTPRMGPARKIPSWQGFFTWSGLDPTTQERKDVRAAIIAYVQGGEMCRPDLWPPTLTLSPTTDRAVPMADLQTWLKRHNAGLCTFQPQPSENKMNEQHYRSLVSLLTAKNIYATATWPSPNGNQVPKLLIFPVNSQGLVGAAFPMTGLPELPRQIPMAPGMPHQFQSLPPETQAMVLANFRRQQQMRAAGLGGVAGQGMNLPPGMNPFQAALMAASTEAPRDGWAGATGCGGDACVFEEFAGWGWAG